MSSITNEKWIYFKRLGSAAKNDKKGPPVNEINELIASAEVGLLSAIQMIDEIMSLYIADDGVILDLAKIHINKARQLLNGVFIIETTGKTLIID